VHAHTTALTEELIACPGGTIRGRIARILALPVAVVLGFLLASQISGGSVLGVVADGDCDPGLVGYEMSVLAERFGSLLTPALVTESRQHLPR
jgi:hypothetical protein